MEKRVAVVTELGVLRGRDCVFLDAASFEYATNTLVIRGDVNGNLCRPPLTGESIPYAFRFTGVLAQTMVELDSWEGPSESSFDEVMDSRWIRKLKGKITEEHHHYVLQTYDDVFEIVCDAWALSLESPRQPAR